VNFGRDKIGRNSRKPSSGYKEEYTKCRRKSPELERYESCSNTSDVPPIHTHEAQAKAKGYREPYAVKIACTDLKERGGV